MAGNLAPWGLGQGGFPEQEDDATGRRQIPPVPGIRSWSSFSTTAPEGSTEWEKTWLVNQRTMIIHDPIYHTKPITWCISLKYLPNQTCFCWWIVQYKVISRYTKRETVLAFTTALEPRSLPLSSPLTLTNLGDSDWCPILFWTYQLVNIRNCCAHFLLWCVWSLSQFRLLEVIRMNDQQLLECASSCLSENTSFISGPLFSVATQDHTCYSTSSLDDYCPLL